MGKQKGEAGAAKHEFLIIIALTAASFAAAAFFDLLEVIADLSFRYEEYEIDETLTALLVFGLCLGVFSWRRWREVEQVRQELQEKNRQLKLALEEIRQLEGIIPICSFCKKIRNDEGFWDSVETYIHNHSEAQMSHSICPDCLQRHYPEKN